MTKDENLMRMIELARGHFERGEGASAEVLYRMVIKDGGIPRTAVERLAVGEACWWYANRALAEGLHGQAIDWYQRAVAADPRCVDYRVQYCSRALMPMGITKTARTEAERAIKIDPECKEAWSVLGDIAHEMMDVEAAAAAYDKRIEMDPDEPNARIDRAALAINVGDYDKVTEMILPIMADPDSPAYGAALHANGMIAYREGRHEEAAEFYTAAIEAGTHDDELVRWNRSLALHAVGMYAQGWVDHEARGKQRGDKSMGLLMNRFVNPAVGDPRFKLDDARCRLHVHQEMGHGDTIAMARYLPALVELGHDVRLEVNDQTVSLLARSFPNVKVMGKAIDYPSALGIPPFDKHLPMLSLPYLFGTTVETIPWRGPYLRPDPTLVESYRPKMKGPTYRSSLRGRDLKVGLCWSSGIRTDGLWISRYGKMKSMHFRDMLKGRLLADLNIGFVSLQVGPERDQNKGYIADLLPAKPSWDDTAALVSNLDLVITVDTSVAHLAGAMGKPVWVLMQKDGASWHFMCERPGAAWNERSPWYPSARIFRQTKPGEWGDVVERVAAALNDKRSEVGNEAWNLA